MPDIAQVGENNMARKISEKVTVKDKLLGGTEVKREEVKESRGLLSGKKVEKTVTKKKI
jgi:hypothetical protein